MTAMTVAEKPGAPLWAEYRPDQDRSFSFKKALLIAAIIEMSALGALTMIPPTGKHIAEKDQVMEVVDVVEEPPPPPEPEKVVEQPKEVEKIIERSQEAPKPQAQPEQAPIPMEAPKPVESAAAAPGGMSVPTAVGESRPAVGNPAPDAKPTPPTGPEKGLVATRKVAIEFPRKARENDIQGLVVAHVHVDENGDVTDVDVKKFPAGGSLLASEVKRKLMQWKFASEGRKRIGLYEINFKITDEEETIEGQ